MSFVPQYYEFLNWYDLDSPIGLYGFIQEMQDNGIDLDDYPDIKVYYDIIYNNAFRDTPNIIAVEYVAYKLKRALIRYGFAHTTKKVEYRLYYFWFESGGT